jgi:acetyl-CoA synthase
MGLEFRVIPLGHDVTSVIHVVTVAIRAALIFGNVQPGDLGGLLEYTKNRVPAFVNTFGAIDAVVVSAGFVSAFAPQPVTDASIAPANNAHNNFLI